MSDTHRNLVETGECVVHIISEWMVEAANQSCGSYAYDVDEIPLSGLTTLPSTTVSPPRIAEAAVQRECKLQHCHPVVNAEGAVTSTICIVEVVTFHINEAVYDEKEQTVDVERLAPMSRLGGDRFGMTSGTFDLPRPNKDGSPGKLRFR
jgi:flavin reductase (DIM6/NTAB) family NADH-FMN oxidoreductase RutF